MLHVLALAKLLFNYLWFLFGVIQTFMLWYKCDRRKINVCVCYKFKIWWICRRQFWQLPWLYHQRCYKTYNMYSQWNLISIKKGKKLCLSFFTLKFNFCLFISNGTHSHIQHYCMNTLFSIKLLLKKDKSFC